LLHHAYVSRQHCELRLEDDRVLVADLESLNGTFVNGAQVEVHRELCSGDILSMGPVNFEVMITNGWDGGHVPVVDGAPGSVPVW
jgi:adenylate cyclase